MSKKNDKEFDVWIGAHIYKVKFATGIKRGYGDIDHDKATIRIEKNCAEPLQRQSTLHEILHAYMMLYNRSDEIRAITKEERLVEVIEPLFNILADERNKSLIKWVLWNEKT